MSVSFVLPDGKSTDLLGQTVPRFPVRTPEDFVRLSEVARDRRELLEVPGASGRARRWRWRATRGPRRSAPPKSYAEATYFPIHAYRWLSLAGHGTWVRYRLVPEATPAERRRRSFTGSGPAARGDPRPGSPRAR